MKKIGIYIGIVFLLFNCKKEVGPQSFNIDRIGNGKLLVLNEGNFGFGNASVSLLNPETGEIANNQYRRVNGVGIGDVLQSVNRYKDKLYFVVNNSGKVLVTDTNLKLLNEISGFNSPRYIQFYGNTAFVSDLKQKAVYVVDLSSNQIINQIRTQGWTEQLIVHNTKLYILDRGDYLTNSGPNYIFVINPTTFQKEDSIQVGINPNSMVIDNTNKLWVLTSGLNTIEKAKIQRINLDSNKLDFTFSFASNSDKPSRLTINSNLNKLYLINSSVYSISTDTSLFNPSMFYQKTSENFYGLFIDSRSNDVYITDAKNYNQQGTVIRLNSNSVVLTIFLSGIIPQEILFLGVH